jgi:hypothetical protein
MTRETVMADWLAHVPPDALADAARHDANPDVRYWAMLHPACAPDALADAARHDANPNVRYWAVRHPACPLEDAAV